MEVGQQLWVSGQDWHLSVWQRLLSKGRAKGSTRRDGARTEPGPVLGLGSQGYEILPQFKERRADGPITTCSKRDVCRTEVHTEAQRRPHWGGSIGRGTYLGNTGSTGMEHSASCQWSTGLQRVGHGTKVV